jgi:hypothetical protein
MLELQLANLALMRVHIEPHNRIALPSLACPTRPKQQETQGTTVCEWSSDTLRDPPCHKLATPSTNFQQASNHVSSVIPCFRCVRNKEQEPTGKRSNSLLQSNSGAAYAASRKLPRTSEQLRQLKLMHKPKCSLCAETAPGAEPTPPHGTA